MYDLADSPIAKDARKAYLRVVKKICKDANQNGTSHVDMHQEIMRIKREFYELNEQFIAKTLQLRYDLDHVSAPKRLELRAIYTLAKLRIIRRFQQ